MGYDVRLRGPATLEDKILWVELVKRGVKRIPKELQNSVVTRSKKDKLGKSIVVRKMSGLDSSSPAAQIIKKFEQMTEGREDVLEKLEALGDKLSAEEKVLCELMRTAPTQKSLARLVAEAKASPAALLTKYAQGAQALGKVQAAIEIARHQPAVVKDLLRHALDGEGLCDVCVGTGTVKRSGRPDHTQETEPCPACKGKGKTLYSSEHKQFAMTKVLEMGKMVEKEPRQPMVAVQQNVGLVGAGGNFVEKLLGASDRILYGQKALPPAAVIEAEVNVLPEDHQRES